MKPISVVIPVFNNAAYVAAAVESVQAQQAPGEIIVVDDGSTDGSGEQAARAGARVLRQANAGIGPARNLGVRASAGEWIAFLDADDLWLPGKLAAQAAVLDEHPEVDMVFTNVEPFLTPELGRPEAPGPVMAGYFAGTMLIRRASLERAGEFAGGWKVGEFIDWFARAREAGLRDHLIPRVYHRRRVHEANTGTRERGHRADFARILKASLDRRRAAGASGP